MQRDWWFNRFFLSIERSGKLDFIQFKSYRHFIYFKGNTFIPIKEEVDERNTKWLKSDAIKLSNNSFFQEQIIKSGFYIYL